MARCGIAGRILRTALTCLLAFSVAVPPGFATTLIPGAVSAGDTPPSPLSVAAGYSPSHSAEHQLVLADTTSRPPGAIMRLASVSSLTTSSYQGWNWARPDRVSYYTNSSGTLTIVAHDSSTNTLEMETIDPSTRQRLGASRTVSLAGWPIWGGFYAGPDGCFYVLVGRENLDEDDARDVVAVRRYDHDWTLLGTAYVKGGVTQGHKGIYRPLAYSAAQMMLVGDRLVVHMDRLLYMWDDGLRHQMNLTFEVNVDSMTATTFSQLGGYAYCGHSFRQMVAMSGSSLVMIDHGDAYPRAIQMGVMANYPTQRQVQVHSLFDFNGAIGDSFTGATVTGLASGPSGIVVVGNSIPHPNAPSGTLDREAVRNIYAIWADPATGNHTVNWLTDFDSTDTDRVDEPRIVELDADRYAVLFTITSPSGHRMEYRLLDSAGTVLASASFPEAYFCAGSDPLLIGGTLYWAGIEPDSWEWPPPGYLFAMDVSDPESPFLLSSPGPSVTRLAGGTRYDTAVAISQHTFPDGAPAVVLATGAKFPDALCAAPLARVSGGPILLVPPSGLTGAVKIEISRLAPSHVYLIGGERAVPTEVAQWLSTLAIPPTVTRLAGTDRYETAAAVARQVKEAVGSCPTIVVATGRNFPDALAAAPIAAAKAWPIILVNDAIPPSAREVIAEINPATSLIAGGSGVVSARVAAQLPSPTRAGGANRYETCALLSDFAVTQGLSYARVGLATGVNFPDALAIGPAVAAGDGVLLLTAPSGPSEAVAARLSANGAGVKDIYVAGGTKVVPDDCVARFIDHRW